MKDTTKMRVFYLGIAGGLLIALAVTILTRGCQLAPDAILPDVVEKVDALAKVVEQLEPAAAPVTAVTTAVHPGVGAAIGTLFGVLTTGAAMWRKYRRTQAALLKTTDRLVRVEEGSRIGGVIIQDELKYKSGEGVGYTEKRQEWGRIAADIDTMKDNSPVKNIIMPDEV